jgi:Zn-dependent protease
MSVIPDPTRCSRCSRTLTPGALACDYCHALVHAADMERLAAEARALEAQSRLMEARNRWLEILPLLPADSKQAEWIRGHARELETAAPAAQRPQDPGAKGKWAKRLAPLGPIAIVLAKLKSVAFVLLKLKFLLSFASFIAVYWAFWGAKFGIGFAVLVLVHEMGHYIDIKRRGLPADMPMFLPGLGAYVRWSGMGVTAETRAAVALAGPLAGLLAAGVCTLIWRQSGDPIWAALARVGAWFNALNLIPLWIFDGAQAVRPLRKIESALLVVVSLALSYATRELIFCFVAAGAVWVIVSAYIMQRRHAQASGATGPGQNIVLAPGVASGPDDMAMPRHESHGIAAYYLAVLTGLAFILWLIPGHGNGLP